MERRGRHLDLLVAGLGIVCAKNLELHLLGQLNWQTAGVWTATLLFPALALAGVAVSVRTWRQEIATLARWRCLLGSASALTLSVWLAAFHRVPFAL